MRGNPGPVNPSQNEWARIIVLRQLIRSSVKVYSSYYTKNTQTVSQFKTRVSKLKVKEIVPGLTKFNSLFSQKSSLFDCRKDAVVYRLEFWPPGIRAFCHVTVQSTTTCPRNYIWALIEIDRINYKTCQTSGRMHFYSTSVTVQMLRAGRREKQLLIFLEPEE